MFYIDIGINIIIIGYAEIKFHIYKERNYETKRHKRLINRYENNYIEFY